LEVRTVEDGFGIKSPAEKLKDCAAYKLEGIELKGGKPILMENYP
jgi:hypothetical protein